MARPALRLRAETEADLMVMSAALQDAIGTVGDIVWEPSLRRLTLSFNRYRWETGGKSRERVRTGLQLNDVVTVRARNIRRERRGAVIQLLAIGFDSGEPPGGTVMFTFAGGGDLRAEVDCLELIMADVSDGWRARAVPDHR